MTPDPNARFRTAVTPHNAVATWGLAENSKKQPLSTHANIGIAIDHRSELLRGAYYDEFLDKTIVDGREWRDADDTGVCMWLQEHIGLSGITPGMVHAVVSHRLQQTPRHCVREWLESLTWDGIERIAHAFEDGWGAEPSATQPSDYLRAISANFFVGLVARIMRPGCQLDTMPVFEGDQGIKKSSALRVLGGAWYMAATESVNSKDFQQTIKGSWIAEIPELDAFSRSDRDRVKSIISIPIDKYRPSYGRHSREFPRQCAFAGTTNKDDWGNDDTGLRRFWPVRCGDINLVFLAAQRDQFFAEAVSAYRAGATWWETPRAATLAAQADRQHDDVWTATVLEWVSLKPDVTSAEVLTGALRFREADIGRLEQLRVGSILRLAGWRRKPIRRNGRLLKAWVSPEEDT